MADPTEQAYVPRGSAILPIASRRSGPSDRLLYGSPELCLTIGRDKHSSGVSVFLRTPSGGMYPKSRLMFAERWNDPIGGEEEIVTIAIQALQAILGEIVGLAERPARD
jgi:hypothetical protein